MSTRDEFVRKIKMHFLLDKGNAEIDAWRPRRSMPRPGRVMGIANRSPSCAPGRMRPAPKLRSLRDAGKGAWQALEAGVELAWEAIGEAIESAKSRIKK